MSNDLLHGDRVLAQARPRQGLGLALAVCASLWMLPGAHAQAPLSEVGQWSDKMDFPAVAVHAHLLPCGKVLFTSRRERGEDLDGVSSVTHKVAGSIPHIWDPATGKFDDPVVPKPPGYNTFCSGHALMHDGRLFVAGGHIRDTDGLPNASIYDPVANAWTALPAMNSGRWYPSALSLANGEVLVASGAFATFKPTTPVMGAPVNNMPQVWGPGGWRTLTGAVPFPNTAPPPSMWPLYPFLHVAPDGRVFMSGLLVTTRLLDTSGAGRMQAVGDRADPHQRDFGSSVMYDVGKVLVVGGGIPPLATAEVIDLNVASPRWRLVGSMSVARRQQNATLLADGKVIVIGGSDGNSFNDLKKPVFSAEIWDPATEKWTVVASMKVPRQYHSTALLLPDARILSAGGGEYGDAGLDEDAPDNHRDAQIYSPPYLFKGNNLATRPVISSAPASVTYGQQFMVGTPARARSSGSPGFGSAR